jgi:hypothetical protein
MRSFDVPLDDERTQLDAFVEEYRSALEVTLDGLTEEQARRHLVSSATTLLGLLKHVTWMQRVWFEECVGGASRQELGSYRARRNPSGSPTTTPSPRSRQPTEKPAPPRGRRSQTCHSTPSRPATGPDRAQFAGCI